VHDENPYQSPTEECFVEPDFESEVLPASSWRRLANLFLDYLGYILLSFVIGIAIAMIEELTGTEGSIEKIPDILFGIVAYLIYYIPQEALSGKTLAKLVTGTRVVSVDGTRPTLAQIVGRTFSRLIPFAPFSFLRGRNPVGWHDRLSNTRVIKDRKLPLVPKP
jgi:uncharacterized RDD family membrane protein YckC